MNIRKAEETIRYQSYETAFAWDSEGLLVPIVRAKILNFNPMAEREDQGEEDLDLPPLWTAMDQAF